jgi:hypothetical protein
MSIPREGLKFKEAPGLYTAMMTFAVLLLLTACASINILMVLGRPDLFILMFVLDGVIAVVAGCIAEWRYGTFFARKAPPPGPPPHGVDELQAIRAAGPMRCRYCETSILPSMVTCPKCGRRIF